MSDAASHKESLYSSSRSGPREGRESRVEENGSGKEEKAENTEKNTIVTGLQRRKRGHRIAEQRVGRAES